MSLVDGRVVTTSFPYPLIDQARYARDREAGTHVDTMDDFNRMIATIH